jgi:hypothetical protein
MLTHLKYYYLGLLFWDHHRINLAQIYQCCNGTKCVAEVRVIEWVTVSIKSDILKGI